MQKSLEGFFDGKISPLLNLNGEAYITHEGSLVLEFVNVAGHDLALALVVGDPGALFCLFLSVFTYRAKDVNDKVKCILVVVEKDQRTLRLKNGFLLTLILLFRAHVSKFICYASFDASLGEKLFTLILDAESAFEEHDFSFSCQVVGETGLIAFGSDATVLGILGENGIIESVVGGANAH